MRSPPASRSRRPPRCSWSSTTPRACRRAYVQRPADIALAAALAAFLVVGGLLERGRPGHPIARLLILEGLVWELGLAARATSTTPSTPRRVAAGAGRGGLDPRLDLGARRGRPAAAAAPVPGRATAVAALAAGGVARARRGRGAARRALRSAPRCCPRRSSRALASLVVRYRRADALERARLRWFAYAAGLIAAPRARDRADALGAPETVTSYLNVLPLAAMPLAIGVALRAPPALRPRDADRPHAARGRARGVRHARVLRRDRRRRHRRRRPGRHRDRRDRDPAAARAAAAPDGQGRLPCT